MIGFRYFTKTQYGKEVKKIIQFYWFFWFSLMTNFFADIAMHPPGHQAPPQPEMSIKVGSIIILQRHFTIILHSQTTFLFSILHSFYLNPGSNDPHYDVYICCSSWSQCGANRNLTHCTQGLKGKDSWHAHREFELWQLYCLLVNSLYKDKENPSLVLNFAYTDAFWCKFIDC